MTPFELDRPPVPRRERVIERLEEELNQIVTITRYGGPLDVSMLVDIQKHARLALNEVKVLKGVP